MRGYKIQPPFQRLLAAFIAISSIIPMSYVFPGNVSTGDDRRLDQFLAKVYQTMDEHYYLPVSKAIYEKFVLEYATEKLKTLNERAKKTPDFVHLGAGLLVGKLKNPQDKYTNFVPPEKEKEFKEDAYALTEDLGIEGLKNPAGFLITRVQKHSEAFEKGLRPGDVILKDRKSTRLNSSH